MRAALLLSVLLFAGSALAVAAHAVDQVVLACAVRVGEGAAREQKDGKKQGSAHPQAAFSATPTMRETVQW